jgi:hypothetical protein
VSEWTSVDYGNVGLHRTVISWQKLGAGKVWAQTTFRNLRRKRWREGNRHGINVLFIERILHDIKLLLKLNRSIKNINNSNSNTFRGQHQYCIRSKYVKQLIWTYRQVTASYSSERNTSSHVCVWSRNIIIDKPKMCVDGADWHTEIDEELIFIIS